MKFVDVRNEETFRAALKDGLRTGDYVGEKGYDAFAENHCRGSLRKAYTFARELLDNEEFEALKWAKQKYCMVKEQPLFRCALTSGSYDGHEGRMRFAVKYARGNFQKAYVVARSLLDDVQHEKLNWRYSDKLTSANKVRMQELMVEHALKETGVGGGSLSHDGLDPISSIFPAYDPTRGNTIRAYPCPITVFMGLKYMRIA
jgi:hypothetical protein